MYGLLSMARLHNPKVSLSFTAVSEVGKPESVRLGRHSCICSRNHALSRGEVAQVRLEGFLECLFDDQNEPEWSFLERTNA